LYSMEIDALVFDIDGTLYPYELMYLKSLPLFVKYPRFIFNFGKVRKTIRKDRTGRDNRAGLHFEPVELFRKRQAELLSLRQGITEEDALLYITRIIYDEWINLFRGIKPYRGVIRLLEYLKGRGIKLGVLSDFPAHVKLKSLGIDKYFNAVLCSEESGKLKPDPAPFKLVCERLHSENDKTLYVGDNPHYDISGAKGAGLKTALFRGVLAKLEGLKNKQRIESADIIFSNYKDFLHILLKIFDN